MMLFTLLTRTKTFSSAAIVLLKYCALYKNISNTSIWIEISFKARQNLMNVPPRELMLPCNYYNGCFLYNSTYILLSCHI